MEQSNRTVSDLFGVLKSWIPRRPEPANVSRDFWMPDHSCRVCYECDVEFTVFNRRHHCRLCGRIFCARCTANSIPAPPSDYNQARDEWEMVRVCNYCFKQWEIATSDNVVNDAGSIPSSSASGGSFASSSSSRTAYCSTVTLGSRSFSLGHFEQMSYSTPLSPCHSAETDPYMSAEMNLCMGGQGEDGSGCSNNSGVYMSLNHLGIDTSRFEYGNDGYPYQLDSKTWADEYYELDELDVSTSNGLQPDGEKPDRKSFSRCLVQNGYDTHDSFTFQDVKHEVDHVVGDECEAPSSSLCAAEDIEMEPVDFENNQLLWLPPEPENEEDENDAILLDEDDEGDGAGDFGCLPASSSFGSADWSCKESFTEDHKKAMKSVVDEHFRALVSQLLQVENISVDEDYGKESWMEIVTSLCWEAATILKPDMSRGGGMDPAGYVKVKCIAGGRRSQSSVVKGVVCKKNVAHRRMKKRAENPRLMILGGALEYQRVSNHLSSVDTLLKQEMEHLKMAVAKIDAHHPDVLLVEKSVSRVAQDYILEKDIILVLKIKRPLLERIARCTGAQIVPSVDHVSAQNIGYCDSFHVERILEEHGSAGHDGKKLSKTLMFIEGCPRPLGCTILLKGAKGDDLKKVKAVIQYAVFAAYHLALETSFLADEGASLPELPLDEPIRVSIPSKSPSVDTSISKFQGFSLPASDSPSASGCLPIDFRASCSSSRPLEGNPFSFGQQKSVQSADAPRDHKFPGGSFMESKSADYNSDCVAIDKYSTRQVRKSSRGNKGESVFEKTKNVNLTPGSSESKATIPPPMEQDAKNDQDEPGSSKEEFPPPSENQSILVTLSSRCVLKGTVCEEVHLVRIKYYGSSDKPLGRVLQDHLFDQSYRCRSCEMPSDAHVQCYTHRQGTLTISVKKFPEILLPGERDGKIWMWHRCSRCPRSGGIPPATRRVIMSDAAWGLSFGKFLELSFSNHAAASRVANCGHSLHRDCLRFYGCGAMVACFRYAPTDLHSVVLPPLKVFFNYEIQEWIKKEADEVVGRAEVLFNEVLSALTHIVEKSSAGGSFQSGADAPEPRVHIAELKEVLQNERIEFEELLRKTLKREVKEGQPIVDILEINRLRRQLLFQSYMWDHRLVYASSLDKNSSPGLPDWSSLDKTPEPQETSATNLLSPGKIFKSVDPLFVHSKSTSQSPKRDPELRGLKHPNTLNRVQEGGSEEAKFVSNVLVDNFDCYKTSEPTDKLESGIRRALSDGHFSFMPNLSDTLDAAWTGKSQPAAVTPKESGFQLCASVSVDSSLAAVVERLAMESQGENQVGEAKIPTAPSPSFSTISKNSDIVEDTMSWFSMPFLNFYRSLNKNFLGFSQKLDTVGGYGPIYVSSYRELELLSGARLLLPVGVNEAVVPVFDDEPTSIIAYTLVSEDYHTQLSDDGYRPKEMLESSVSLPLHDSVMFNSFHSGDESVFKNPGPLDDNGASISSVSGSQSSLVSQDSTVYPKSLHFRVSFSGNGPLEKVKYSVTCYYAKQFEALRKICCPSEVDFVRSLSRCKKWGAQGGKSNVFFAKTLDDRFIIKQVTKTELESFIKFAPEYFKYMTEAISMGSPTCLAKILGIYQIVTKSFKGGKDTKIDVLVMENLLFGRKVTRLYDLKGSARSRYNPDTNGSNKVLLDQNLLETMPTSPIFVGKKAKRTLERAVWNDTSFLATVDVMDYSLLAGIDEKKHELVLGIIDFMRQYTWDKHLETWVKASGILGGPKNASPTVISPMQYKKRFRKAMSTYFLVVPDQWFPLGINPSSSEGDLCEDNSQTDENTAKVDDPVNVFK